MAYRLGTFAVVLIPLGRAPMELHHVLGPFIAQARLEHVGEQMVVPIPLPPVVQRDEEQVLSLERLQHRLAAVLAGNGIGQRAIQPAENRGLQQERADRFGLALQDLFNEVVDDVSVVSRKTRDEAGDVVSPLHREPRELDGGDPAFGPALQHRDILCRQPERHHPVEERAGLVGCEAQIDRADLDQVALCAEAGQRQRRVGASDDHQVDLRR